VRLFRETASRFYPRILDNPDYTAIINSRHYERLERLIGDARAKGARIETIDPAGELAGAHGSPQLRRMAPTAIADVTDAMTVAREEIFGPLLPIVAYDTLEDAIGYVNARPRPLALYYSTTTAPAFDTCCRTRSRAASPSTIPSTTSRRRSCRSAASARAAMGSYHGRDGFNTFSHAKGVFLQSRLTPTSLMTPPYDAWFQRIIRFLIRSHGG
jgi:acyl-CoA reductase-like NAD-dependent aldehyde dehydrogenase